ncbi:hypothetical protein ES705_38100 [subsurface metagenome]
MAKPKSPLLSFGARGTIADSLTFQKRGRTTIARTKPIPTDPYSLAQAYQRWDYQDYAYLWTLQSEAVKQTYRTRASRYHITGFSLWMREHLRDLPDLVGRWHLDELGGATVYDSSKQGNNGTIFGPTPTDGLIAGAYHFDGTNDYIDCGNNPVLNLLGLTVTFEAFVKTSTVVQIELLLKTGIGPYWIFTIRAEGTVWAQMWDGAKQMRASSIGVVNDGIWHHIAAVLENNVQAKAYIDGIDDSAAPTIQDLTPSAPTGNMLIGSNAVSGNWFAGDADHIVIHNRVLDPTEILRHSKRRYPV